MAKCAAVMILILLSGASASAQISVEEARQRLLERQSHRAAQSRPASLPASQPVDVETDQSLHEAWGKLLAKDYNAGVGGFGAVLAKQPSNVSALEGRGICNYELSKYTLATDDLERALQLGKSKVGFARQTTLAAAAASIGANVPLHAVKLALDSLKQSDKAGVLDEEMQNVLGTAIWRCKSDTRSMALLREAGKFYLDYDEKLAAPRNANKPRQFSYDVKDSDVKSGWVKRWGTQWLAAEEAEKKWHAYGDAVAANDAAGAALAQAAAVNRANEKALGELHVMSDNNTAGGLRGAQVNGQNYGGVAQGPNYELNRIGAVVQNSRAAEAAAREKSTQAAAQLASIESPPFPKKAEPAWSEPINSQGSAW